MYQIVCDWCLTKEKNSLQVSIFFYKIVYFVCSCGCDADRFIFTSSHDTCSLFMWMRPTERSPSLVTKQPSLSNTPHPITHTLIHPSSTLESIDKQHKQQRGDKRGDNTKPCKQQDFNRRNIFQINIPKQHGLLVARQEKQRQILFRVSLICKEENKFLPLIWRILHYPTFSFLRSFGFVRKKHRRFAVQSVYAAWVCRCLCVCVGLRQNRAAEMRQALQIFVGWLTAPCRCQAPTAETTKRRIRLALEPQIFSPPSLLLFSPSLFSLRGLLWSGSDSIWQHSHSSVNLSICLYFALIWWGCGGE